jgi:flagellar motor switch protein FliM
VGDVLSQSQIDELLNSFSNEGTKAFDNLDQEANEKKIKKYDFKMPKKFTKEQLKMITDIYETYSRLLSSYLTSITRLYCQVKVLQVEEQRYFEFNNALPDYVFMGTVNLGIEDKEIVDSDCIIQISNTMTLFIMVTSISVKSLSTSTNMP